MVSKKHLETQLLSTLRASGRARPSVLVENVVSATHSTNREVKEALGTLVDRRQVALTWNGELEASGAQR